MNRRSFFKFGACAAVGAAVASVLGPSTSPAISSYGLPPRGVPLTDLYPDGIYWNGARVIVDDDCGDRVYFVNLKSFERDRWGDIAIRPGFERTNAMMKL